MNKVNVYVDTDGKLHYVNRNGADSVLPFNKGGGLAIVNTQTILNSGASASVTIKSKSEYIFVSYSGAIHNSSDTSISIPTISISGSYTIISETQGKSGTYSNTRGGIRGWLIKKNKDDSITVTCRVSSQWSAVSMLTTIECV